MLSSAGGSFQAISASKRQADSNRRMYPLRVSSFGVLHASQDVALVVFSLLDIVSFSFAQFVTGDTVSIVAKYRVVHREIYE